MDEQWWVPGLAGLVVFPIGVAMVRFSVSRQLGASQTFRAWIVLLAGLACLIGSVVILFSRAS